MRAEFVEELPEGAGGRLHSDLPSRSRAHLLRGHVTAIQGSEVRAIVNSDAITIGLLCDGVLSQSNPFLSSCINIGTKHRDGLNISKLKRVTCYERKARTNKGNEEEVMA